MLVRRYQGPVFRLAHPTLGDRGEAEDVVQDCLVLRQARASVLELHRQLLDVVVEHGHVPGPVEIRVLTIEEPEG